MPRLKIGKAIAADGKRIRGANRNGDQHYETVTLVAHDSTVPVASLVVREDGGEQAALGALLEQVDISGRVLTMDALHTTRNTAHRIVDIHGADYLMTVKGNASETHEILSSIDWERAAERCFEAPVEKGHGRVETRAIHVMTPLKGMINYPHVKQIFRVSRTRYCMKDGKETREFAFGMTSVPAERSSPQQLLEWNRGHWCVEGNHRHRDVTFSEDACLLHTGNAPAVSALINNIALAVIFNRGHRKVAEKIREFSFKPETAFEAVLSPT